MGCGTTAVQGAAPGTSIAKSDLVSSYTSPFEKHYQLVVNIGRGNYGEVWKVKHKVTGEVRAAKIIKKDLLKEKQDIPEMIKAECEILKKLDSPHVVKLYEVFEDKKRLIMILEVLQGKTLFEYIATQPQTSFTEKFVANVLKQILLGLSYCHAENLAHRNISPENVIFTGSASNQLKLIDFDFAGTDGNNKSKYQTALGTPLYMAPEVAKKKPYDNKCDIWSTGILGYILLSGLVPYNVDEETSTLELFAQIKNKVFLKRNFTGCGWKSISQGAKDFLLKMLDHNPKTRATARDLLNDPWLANAKDEQPDPEAFKKAWQNITSYNGQHMFQKMVLHYIAYHSDLTEETKNLTKMFEVMDKDKSQTLTKEEFQKGIAEVGMVLPEDEIDKIFNELDKDKSGRINYTEFVSGFMDRNLLITEKKLEAAFKFFDKDGSGSINKEEVMTSLKEGWISDVQLAELFKSADTNKDNKLSFEEFKTLMKKVVEKTEK